MSSFFKNAIIVVAHPDDEVLWFSSILQQVKKVLICYTEYEPEQELTLNRNKLVSNYPLPNVQSLKMPEPCSFNMASWSEPVITDCGLQLADDDANYRYKKAYNKLRDQLAGELSNYDIVLTHNPWGEYGHEDHVQLYHVINELQKEMCFQLWVSSYYSNRSAALAEQYRWNTPRKKITFPVPVQDNMSLMQLYMEHDCWTWDPEWEWPEKEAFYCAEGLTNISTTSEDAFFTDLNFIAYDVDAN